jgi:membrane-bound ClpP family serine protease
MNNHVTIQIEILLKKYLMLLEQKLTSDVLTYYGPILDEYVPDFLQIIEQTSVDSERHDDLFVMLTTLGGSPFAVERFVNIIRQHYKEVNFIVPDCAYSAGTIFCMSGDKIYMDYSSVLGPIDPQVVNPSGRLVPALGYLGKIEELIQKSREGTMTQAEFFILKDFDLAELRSYEQAKELTIDQLKNWLVKYKFKNWNVHGSNGLPVTLEDKQKRAEEIAVNLSDSKLWKSHGRPINITILTEQLKLQIEDFGKDTELKELIRQYHSFVSGFVNKNNLTPFIQTRNFV